MEMLWDLAVNFWQWTVFGVLVLIDLFLIYSTDKAHRVVGMAMPYMKPLPIETKTKAFLKQFGITMGVRHGDLEDFHFQIKGKYYIVPKGFTFDGASVLKFLAMCFLLLEYCSRSCT